MLHDKVLIFELRAVYTERACSVVIEEVSALDHELRDTGVRGVGGDGRIDSHSGISVASKASFSARVGKWEGADGRTLTSG